MGAARVHQVRFTLARVAWTTWSVTRNGRWQWAQGWQSVGLRSRAVAAHERQQLSQCERLRDRLARTGGCRLLQVDRAPAHRDDGHDLVDGVDYLEHVHPRLLRELHVQQNYA